MCVCMRERESERERERERESCNEDFFLDKVHFIFNFFFEKFNFCVVWNCLMTKIILIAQK